MNGTQITITILYSVVTVLGVAGLVWIFLSTRNRAHADGGEVNVHKLERGENWWAVFAGAVLIIFFVATLAGIPWFARADASQEVNVRALQFAFVVQPAQVPVGTTDFKVRSDDVSHGFGLYDPDDVLVDQIQIIPGVTSTATVDLDEPGTYTIRCLEFCGFNHHNMIGRIEVTQ